jgi:hypothetical protein
VIGYRSFALQLEACQCRFAVSAYQADSDYADDNGDASGSVAENASAHH